MRDMRKKWRGEVAFFWVLGAVIAASVCGDASAFAAKTEAEINDAIEFAIHERHPTVGGDWWRALGPETPRILIQKYQTNTNSFQRLRLLEGLAWFDDPEAARFLKNVAENTENEVVRQSALRTLGASQGAKEEEFISKFLKNPDPQTRKAALDALKKMKDPRATQVMESHLKEENTPWIGAALKNQPLPVPRKLSPSGSSEDRLNPEFAGTWKGFWLAPELDKPEGMNNYSTTVRLTAEGSRSVTGEVIVALSKGVYRTYTLQQVVGKGSQFEGMLVVGKSRKTLEARLEQRGGVVWIEMKVPQMAAVLLGRKSSARP